MAASAGGAGDPAVIGRPLPGITVRVLNAAGALQPMLWPGELVVSGRQVPAGLCNASDQAYHTGDICRWLPDGTLQWLGRRDDQTKVNGVRIDLQGIRGLLLEKLAEAQLATEVVVICHEGLPVAHVVAAAGVPPELHAGMKAALEAVSRQHLMAAECPRIVLHAVALPRTPTDKIDVVALKQPRMGGPSRSQAHSDTDTESNAPTGLIEIFVAQVWQHALGLPWVSRDDVFGRLGGDSLAAMRAVLLLRNDLTGTHPDRADLNTGRVAGPFAPAHLRPEMALREYAAFLDLQLDRGRLEVVQRPDGDTWMLQTSAPLTEPSGSDTSSSSTEMGATLMQAAALGCTPLADFILRNQLRPPNPAPRQRQWTPLHAAAKGGHSETVTMLLRCGCSPMVTNQVVRSFPAHIASAASAECLAVLLAAGTPISVRDANKQSLLHWAARAGNASSILLLLGRGDHDLLSSRDRWHRTALQWAVLNGHLAAVQALLAGGADVNSSIRHGQHLKRTHLVQESALHLGVRIHGCNLPLIAALLAAGADVNAMDSDGNTVVHTVATRMEHKARAAPPVTNAETCGAPEADSVNTAVAPSGIKAMLEGEGNEVAVLHMLLNHGATP